MFALEARPFMFVRKNFKTLVSASWLALSEAGSSFPVLRTLSDCSLWTVCVITCPAAFVSVTGSREDKRSPGVSGRETVVKF